MPYISRDQRHDLNPTSWVRADTAGELTYQLTDLVIGFLGASPSFGDYAEAIAALECTKLELYRRSVAPHEDAAIARNGDLAYPGAS